MTIVCVSVMRENVNDKHYNMDNKASHRKAVWVCMGVRCARAVFVVCACGVCDVCGV